MSRDDLDEQDRCPRCGALVTVTYSARGTSRVHAHKTPDGRDCRVRPLRLAADAEVFVAGGGRLVLPAGTRVRRVDLVDRGGREVVSLEASTDDGRTWFACESALKVVLGD